MNPTVRFAVPKGALAVFRGARLAASIVHEYGDLRLPEARLNSLKTMIQQTLEQRREFSEKVLGEFAGAVGTFDSFRDIGPLCIYTTGSYGRLEASEHSDLDLFFITAGDHPSRIGKILLDADLIRLTRDMKLPDPSGDGEYLMVHRLDDMRRHLGGPSDDYENYFTARMLLLLESRPVAAAPIFEHAVREILQWYFRDYDDHAEQFRPVFLANDIIRFWKTLCLNYENRRNAPQDDAQLRAKHRVKNLKLKFSRMNTCFSTLVAIAAQPTVTPEALAELVSLTPWERLNSVVQGSPERERAVNNLRNKYEWFLTFSAQSPKEQREALNDPAIRASAFNNAEEFGASMYELLDMCASDSTRRYLVI